MILSPCRRAVRALHACIVFVSVAETGRACLWEYGADMQGHRRTVEGDCDSYFLYLTQPPQPDWPEKRRTLEKRLTTDPDYKLRSDHAVALIHVGEVAAAVAILELLAIDHPGEYVIASNLGTAYELNGEDEKALSWIRKAVELNPQSHFGTEWVHVRILEAKLAAADDPSRLSPHSVLGLDFGADTMPRAPIEMPADSRGRSPNLESARKALEYQLRERLVFVKPPEPIVAALLFDLANAAALTLPADCCVPVFELALAYGHPDRELVGRRLAGAREIAERNEWRRRTAILRKQPVVLVASLVAVLGGLLVYRRRARASP